MVKDSSILYEVKNRTAWITLNRPEAYNILDLETLNGLAEALRRADEDPGVLTLIITGAGEKAFSAGADVKEFKKRDEDNIKEFLETGQQTILQIIMMQKLTIALINGIAAGGGCELALACDIRLSSINARFGQPEVKLGLIPGWGGTVNLERIVGSSRARELLLTGRFIDSKEAERIGLVNRVVPLSELKTAAIELTDEIKASGPLAVKAVKRILSRSEMEDLKKGFMLEKEHFLQCVMSRDGAEGISAFLEKRKPGFEGR